MIKHRRFKRHLQMRYYVLKVVKLTIFLQCNFISFRPFVVKIEFQQRNLNNFVTVK